MGMLLGLDVPTGTLIDIGRHHISESLRALLEIKFLPKENQTQCLLPSALLSDEAGLQLWKRINRLETYYQTSDEISLLQDNGKEISTFIEPSTIIIDLGAGDTRKIEPLLDQIELEKKDVSYYALDLSREVLVENIEKLAAKYTYIKCFGLLGTLDDGLAQLHALPSPRLFLSLGSLLGNDHLEPSIAHLRKWRTLMRREDRMIVGMDSNFDNDKVWASYHDKHGLFLEFMRNGLAHSNRVLGHEWYRREDWEVLGILTEEPYMHRFVVKSVRDVECLPLGIRFPVGHEIDCYEAFKYDPQSMLHQFTQAGFDQIAVWKSPKSDIYEYLLQPS